ncbi:MAG: cell envelope integrity protein CreD [Flavobacteriaceae bacterium CG2_30_34_30]|nr:cell envelope integrity protein CreD [Flavobacteriales bacterium]OIP51600.1 MAG: cell envelope integrity protein CreD [Flavobacteriaceae bacterium CG2_30_34_30]
MEQNTSKFSYWLRNSITVKMLVVGFLFLVLLIPLEFVKNLISERSNRQKEVVNEINEKWGNEIVISGPILKIPYKTFKEQKVSQEGLNKFITTQEVLINYAYFFPEQLVIDSKVTTKPLNRSIYESVVFQSDIHFKGNFPVIDFKENDISEENVLWDKATILVKTSNLKGIRNTLEVNFNAETLHMIPKYDTNYLNTLESEAFSNQALNTKPSDFSFQMKVNGSQSVSFIPLGKETSATMESNWHSPSFIGEFLPEDGSREISDTGFKASWNILQINRQFEQSFFEPLPDLNKFAFGTQLIVPVDEYQKSERTAKYGILVIGLTLLVFFLIQLISKIYIHPFQYVMIGLALVMFYTLLISISEHSSFLKAYLIAAISVLTLITLYSKTILKGLKFPLLICFSLGVLYSYIYIIIQLENYALLTGSIGLFIILAIIMFSSKKIDWQK